MNSRQNGFSLIEVLVSLIMVSVTITSLLSLQSTLQKMLFNDTLHWKAEQYAYKIFAENQKKEDIKPGDSFEHQQDGFTAVYSFSAFKQDDPLGKIKNLYCEKVIVSWTRLVRTSSLTFVRYVYRPSEKDDKEAEAKPDQEALVPKAQA